MDLKRALVYAVTLPERTLRSLAAAIGGVSKLMTDALLPRSLRRTATYETLLGNTQRFLISSMGGVRLPEAGPAAPDDFVARKLAGNVADAAGLFALHFSPLWFFALAADALSGTKVYLARVVAELKKEGAIAADASVRSAEELLEALSGAARTTSVPFDLPPLSKEEFGRLTSEIVRGYRAVYAKSAALVPAPEELWKTLEELRRKEALPLVTAAGTLALSGAKAAGRASGALLYDAVVRSYADSLEHVRREGFAAILRRESRPYVEAIADAFAPGKRTFTEKLLSGWPFRRA